VPVACVLALSLYYFLDLSLFPFALGCFGQPVESFCMRPFFPLFALTRTFLSLYFSLFLPLPLCSFSVLCLIAFSYFLSLSLFISLSLSFSLSLPFSLSI